MDYIDLWGCSESESDNTTNAVDAGDPASEGDVLISDAVPPIDGDVLISDAVPVGGGDAHASAELCNAWADQAGHAAVPDKVRRRRVRTLWANGMGLVAQNLKSHPLPSVDMPEPAGPPIAWGPAAATPVMEIEAAAPETPVLLAEAAPASPHSMQYTPDWMDEVPEAPAPAVVEAVVIAPAPKPPSFSDKWKSHMVEVRNAFGAVALLVKEFKDGGSTDRKATKVANELTSKKGVLLSHSTLTSHAKDLGVPPGTLASRSELLAATRWHCILFGVRQALRCWMGNTHLFANPRFALTASLRVIRGIAKTASRRSPVLNLCSKFKRNLVVHISEAVLQSHRPRCAHRRCVSFPPPKGACGKKSRTTRESSKRCLNSSAKTKPH